LPAFLLSGGFLVQGVGRFSMGFLDSILAPFKKQSGMSQQKKKSDVRVTVISTPINPLQMYNQRPASTAVPPVPPVMPSVQVKQPEQQAKPLNALSAQPQFGGSAGKPPGSEESQKSDSKLSDRINELESKVQKLEAEIGKLSRENETAKSKLAEIDARLVEMLSMYELISNQINPFVGDSKSIQLVVNDLKNESERLRNEFENLKANTETNMKELKDKLNIISNDVNILSSSRINVTSVVKAILTKKNKEKEKVRALEHVKNEMKQKEKKEEVKRNG